MKSISIAFNAPSVTIPIGYHHQVQGLIYHLLRSGGGGGMHDEGADFGLRPYKLFTFSSLRGGRVSGDRKSIVFESAMFLDVRSVRPAFCDALLAGLQAGDAPVLFGRPLSVRFVKTSDAPVAASRLRVKMLSPLTVHRTGEGGHTDYLNPLSADFAEEVDRNFARKYAAFYGRRPSAGVVIKAASVGARDRYLTLYKKAEHPGEKDIYITGWRGEYDLSGRPEHLNFLYYCGLGARNSDGFGLFEPV
jgi:CRISPR-associated endoribonuclease Cas6